MPTQHRDHKGRFKSDPAKQPKLTGWVQDLPVAPDQDTQNQIALARAVMRETADLIQRFLSPNFGQPAPPQAVQVPPHLYNEGPEDDFLTRGPSLEEVMSMDPMRRGALLQAYGLQVSQPDRPEPDPTHDVVGDIIKNSNKEAVRKFEEDE